MKLIDRIKRAAFEWKAKPAVPLDGKQMRGELDGLMFGLRCMMALGGYKVAPKGMSEDEIKARGDQTSTLCANLHLMVRCAEEVILRHGLVREYRQQLQDIEKKLSVPPEDQIAATRAMLKVVKDVDVQGVVGKGNGSLDQESVRGDNEEIPESG